MYYYELGVTYQQCLQNNKAKKALLKAKEIIETSNDITEDKTKFYLNSVEQITPGEKRVNKVQISCDKLLIILLVLVVVLGLVLCFIYSASKYDEFFEEETSASSNQNSVEVEQWRLATKNNFKESKKKLRQNFSVWQFLLNVKLINFMIRNRMS